MSRLHVLASFFNYGSSNLRTRNCRWKRSLAVLYMITIFIGSIISYLATHLCPTLYRHGFWIKELDTTRV